MTHDEEVLRFIPSWYVVFSGPWEPRFLVDYFTEPGFRHCMAFGYDTDAERWLLYDVTRAGTAVIALTSEQIDPWITQQRAGGARILKINLPDTVRVRNWLQTGMWCVTATVHLVGIRSSAWRPRALWRDLLKNGATEAFTDGYLDAAT